MIRDEPEPSLRTIPLLVKDTSGNGVPGIVWAAGDVKLHKHGGSWAASTNLPVETIGGAAGSYQLLLTLAEINAYGPLFYWVERAGIKTIVSAVIIESTAGSFSRNEPLAALRTIPIYLMDTSGDGVPGIPWTAGDSKIHKTGDNWVNSSNLPVEITGGPDGPYTLLLERDELDTRGPLFWQLTGAEFVTFVDAITVEDADPIYRMRARDTSLARTVFWNSPLVDTAGDYYEGPGPLTGAVVQAVKSTPATPCPECPDPTPVDTVTDSQWNYDNVNQTVPDLGSPVATNRRAIRTLSLLQDAVVGASVSYSCDGVISGTPGDGINHWPNDGSLVYGNGTTLPSSWMVHKFAGMTRRPEFARLCVNGCMFRARQPGAAGNLITISVVKTGNPDAVFSYTEIGNALTITTGDFAQMSVIYFEVTRTSTLVARDPLGPIDNQTINTFPEFPGSNMMGGDNGTNTTYANNTGSLYGGLLQIRSRYRGAAGNNLTFSMVGDAPGLVYVEQSGYDVIFHYQSGVSTLSEVLAAINTVSPMHTDSTYEQVLVSPADDFINITFTGGGAAAPASASEVLLNLRAAGSQSVISLFGGVVVISSRTTGTANNGISIRGVGDSGGGVTVDETGAPAIVVHYESGVSTRQDIADALNALSTLVQAVGGDATVLTSPADDFYYSWATVSVATVPPYREYTQMTYDVVRDRTVFFSGLVAGPTVGTDTWEWDGTNWTHVFPGGTPGGRVRARMVYDIANSWVFMFGGITNPGPPTLSNQSYSYDGSTWSLLSSGPSARYDVGLAYDSVRSKVVLFGGFNVFGSEVGETWEFDSGTLTWAQLFPSTSPFSNSGTLCFHNGTGLTVLLASDGSTWTWDGTDWTQQFPVTSGPGGNFANSAAHDDNTGCCIFRVGYSTWEWNGTNWRDLTFPSDGFSNEWGIAGGQIAYHASGLYMLQFGGGSGFDDRTWKHMGGAAAFMLGGIDETGQFVDVYVSRAAGFTGGDTILRPTATDEFSVISYSLGPNPGDSYNFHMVFEQLTGKEFRIMEFSIASVTPRFIQVGQAHTENYAWTQPTIASRGVTSAGSSYLMESQIGQLFSYNPNYNPDGNDYLAAAVFVDDKIPMLPCSFGGVQNIGPIGFCDDMAQAGSIYTPTGSVEYGDYIIDQYNRRWVAVDTGLNPLVIRWPIGKPNLKVSPVTRIGKMVSKI